MMLRSLLVISYLLHAMPAQEVRPLPPRAAKQSPIGALLHGDGAADSPAKPVKLTKEQRANAGARRGASSYCQFHVNSKPSKLMPGQTGTLVVTAVLKGQAVLPSPAPLEVMSVGRQGMLTLGPATFQPARMGRIESAYMGRAVYENWATIELPITMSTDAVIGQKYNVGVEMRFDLFDGKTAQSIGKFLDRAVGTVEVGESFDPEVRGGYTPPVSSVPTSNAGPGDDSGQPDPAPTNDAEALGAASTTVPVKVPEPVVTDPITEPAAMPEITEDEGGFWILIAGAGALLAAVVLLMLNRNRK